MHFHLDESTSSSHALLRGGMLSSGSRPDDSTSPDTSELVCWTSVVYNMFSVLMSVLRVLTKIARLLRNTLSRRDLLDEYEILRTAL
jgi:hypothetical protein